MVEHDVLALEGRRLKGSLVAAGQEIGGLENRKAQLRFSMEERKQQIQVSPLPHTAFKHFPAHSTLSLHAHHICREVCWTKMDGL